MEKVISKAGVKVRNFYTISKDKQITSYGNECIGIPCFFNARKIFSGNIDQKVLFKITIEDIYDDYGLFLKIK